MLRVALILLLSAWCLNGALAAGKVQVTVGGTAFPNTTGEQQWLQFERSVVEQAGDEFELRMLIYGQLGSEEQLVSGLRRGRRRPKRPTARTPRHRKFA